MLYPFIYYVFNVIHRLRTVHMRAGELRFALGVLVRFGLDSAAPDRPLHNLSYIADLDAVQSAANIFILQVPLAACAAWGHLPVHRDILIAAESALAGECLERHAAKRLTVPPR